MDKWGLLGIEATTDKLKIKEAYMEKLTTVHPEEDPEGFKLLRATYEELLEIASKEIIEEVQDTSPIGLWKSKLKSIYNTFSLRLKEDVWNELLNDDICFALDSKEDALHALLEFLMENFYLPNFVWRLIEETFSIKDKQAELREAYPEGFINYVISVMNYGDGLNYDLFEIDDDKDYEEFISQFFTLRRSINRGELEEVPIKLEDIKEFDIDHPYITVLEIRYSIAIDEYETARELGETLINKYPNDIYILLALGKVEWYQKNIEKAKEYYEEVLTISENNYEAKSGVADCLLELGSYKEAKDLYRQINNINPYDNYIRGMIYNCNEKLIDLFSNELKEKPGDNDVTFNLVWTLFENFKSDEAIEVAKDFVPDDKYECEYYDLMAKLYSTKKEYKKALDYTNQWLQKIENDIISKTLDEEKARVSYANFEKGRILANLKDYEEALKYINNALDLEPSETYFLNHKAQVLNKLERYKESIAISEQSIELDNAQAGPFISRATSFYELGYAREAIDDCDTAIDIYPYYTESYVIKLKVYLDYSKYDDMVEVIKITEDLEIDNDTIKLYKIKAISRLGKYAEANEIGYELIDKITTNEITDIELISDLYSEMAMTKMCENDSDMAMEYIEKSINTNPTNLFYQNYKAYIYKQKEEYNKALDIYMELVDKAPNNVNPYIDIGDIYERHEMFDDAISWYEKVLEIYPEHEKVNYYIANVYEKLHEYENQLTYLNKQIEISPNEYCYMDRGIAQFNMCNFDEALNNYNEVLKIDPEDKYAYNAIGYVYERLKQYDEAIENYQKSIDFDKEKNFPNPYINIADVFIAQGKRTTALEYYDIGISAMPDCDSFYGGKGKLYKTMRRYDEAISNFEKAIELNDNSIHYYDDIGLCYIYVEEDNKAIEAFKRVIELDANHYHAYQRIAQILFERKEYKKAIEFMKKQIEVDPEDYENYIVLGRMYKRCGKKLALRSIIKKAIKHYLSKDQLNACDYCRLGSCYILLDKFNEGKEQLEKAIKESTNCRVCNHDKCYEAYIQLGFMNEDLNKYTLAIEYYKKAIRIKDEDDIDCIFAFRRLREYYENLMKIKGEDDADCIYAMKILRGELI